MKRLRKWLLGIIIEAIEKGTPKKYILDDIINTNNIDGLNHLNSMDLAIRPKIHQFVLDGNCLNKNKFIIKVNEFVNDKSKEILSTTRGVINGREFYVSTYIDKA